MKLIIVLTNHARRAIMKDRVPLSRGCRALLVLAPLQTIPMAIPLVAAVEPTWHLRATTGPSARTDHAMAFDSTRGVTVLFGGSAGANETWEWNGSVWTLRATSGPSGRIGHAMAYDSARGVTVLFGGNPGGGETWEWNGATWTQRMVAGPPNRRDHAMAYDSARGVTVLYGGFKTSPPPTGRVGDTWEWNGTTWTQQSTTGPAARIDHAMAYDATRGRVVLFGGLANTVNLRDTWEWNGSAWVQHSTCGPNGQRHHGVAYDSDRDVVALSGISAPGDNCERATVIPWNALPYTATGSTMGAGDDYHTDDCNGIDGRANDVVYVITPELNTELMVTGCHNGGADTAYDSRAWVYQGGCPCQPGGPDVPIACSDDGCGTFTGPPELVFSVTAGGTYYIVQDGWSGSRGAFGIQVTEVAPRSAPQGPQEADDGAATAFQGAQDIAETWEWNGTAWSLQSTTGPSPRQRHAMTFDSARGGVVLFGGTAGGGETWERMVDCNNNSVDDTRDIAVGVSQDCNGNGIPDECDTAEGTSPDCNLNAIPDECEGQPVVYVDAAATGANDGKSWGDAYTSLQSALCIAASGGSFGAVWMADGTYRPDETAANPTGTGDRTATFQLINGVVLYGGFAGGEISLLQRDPAANPTILSGDLLGNDDEFDFPDGPTYADNAYHVVTDNPSVAAAVLDGLTITGGNANGASPHQNGGGMLVNPTGGANSVLRNCTLTLNSASNVGGGVYHVNAPPAGAMSISDCTFHRNAAAVYGGAIAEYFLFAINPLSLLMTDCVFTENSATLSGGAAFLSGGRTVSLNCRFDDNMAGVGGAIACYNSGGEPTVSLFHCRFRRNTADLYGGALWLQEPGYVLLEVPAADVVGCAFIANSAAYGGAVYIEFDQELGGPNHVIDCTFTANSASNTAGGIYSVGTGWAGAQNRVSNSLFWANQDSGGMGQSAQTFAESGAPTVNYCLVQGGWSGPGGGNVNADPLFLRDPDPGPDGLWNGINDDFGDLRLAAGSPAIDAGNNTLVVADTGDLDCDGNPLEATPLDFDGGPRFIDHPTTPDTGVAGNGYTQIVDMGAHEAGGAPLDRLFVNDAASGANDGSSWADAYVELRDALALVAANECSAVEVWVAAGDYRPAPPGGSRDATFQLVDAVAVLGGFAGGETSSDQRNPALNVMTLSGDLAGNDSGGPADPSRGENSFRVVTGTGTGPTAVLDGFTITGGNAESPRTGGGLITLAGGPTLRDCVITGNTAGCSEQLDSSGGVLTAEGLTLDLGAEGAGFDQSIIDVQGMLTTQSGEFDVFGTTLTGPGTLQLASGATMNVRNASPCGAQTATRSAGPVAATGIYQPQAAGPPAVPARWEINGTVLNDVVISGPTRTWVIAPSGISTPATLTWTGNFLEEDRSSSGRAQALFHEHGVLTITGSVYEGANPLFSGTLVTAKVSEFHVQESATTANLLTFVQPPVLTLTGGYLVENDQGLILAGNQKLTLTGASVQQDGGAWSTFATSSTLTLTGPAQLSLEPANPPQTAMIVRSAVRGTGDIDIEFGGALILEEEGSLNLSGLPDEVCVTTDVPGAPPGGTVSVNGSLIVRDTARVHNTQVDVNLADFGDGSTIVHNDLSLVEGSTGFGGEFFASGSATISCNRVTAYGDRIMDLDPDPDDGEAPILVNNQFFVIISQGVDLEQGELFELRATDHDCADTNGCASGAFQLASGAGYDDTWTLEELEVLPGAKVNLTNRIGFDFAPTDPIPETVYVKSLVLGDGAILNTGLQRLYYQNLTLGTGAQVLDIPMLGFSLKIIAMEDDVEFDVRVRTRLRDPADDPQPLIPPFKEGSITRVEGLIPAASSNGVMDMRTQADAQLSAASVAARGSFARAGEDEIVVAFEYLFVENPAAELIVYLGDTPDAALVGCTTNGCCDDDRCEVARVYVPPDGRDGSATSLGGTGQFATFYGTFPRGNLNFHRGTYVELELRGTNARVWIDEWDPRIRCSGCADLNGTGGPEGEDYLLLLASFGLDIDANTRAESGQQENADCFDSVLGGDRYVDTGDLLAWDTFLDEDALNACGTGVRGEPLVRESFLEPRFGGFQSHVQFRGMDSPPEGPEIGISGQQSLPHSDLLVAGKPNGAGLQDDYLYPVAADGSCPGGSPLPAASGAGTRGHGRLVTAPDGTLYQLHATGGVLPVEGGAALVAPATNLIPQSDSSLRVTVGVNDFGGGEFLGLPIADAAFHPANANVLYVLPVLVTPFGGDTCDRYKAAAKLVISGGGGYTVERLYEVPAANRTPPCDWPPQLDQGEFREIEVSTDGTKVFIASARADNDNDWLLVFNESSGALATSALIGEVPPEGMMPAGLTVAAPLAMLASRTGGTPYLYLAAGVNAAPSETVGGQSVARTRLFRFNVSSGVTFAGALDISSPECVNPYDTLGCTSTLTALAENPNDGTLYALGFTAPRFDLDYPYNQPPFGGPDPGQIVIFTTPTLATIPPSASWSMTVPPSPPTAAEATANRVTCADLALPISLAWNAASCGAAGDMDGDGDVQLDDWDSLAGCLTGPAGALAPGCGCADTDSDADADLADVAGFLSSFGP